MPRKAPADDLPEAHAEVASTKHMGSDDAQSLRARIADLEKQLGIAEEGRSAAEKAALQAAEGQSTLMQRDIREVPTGKFVTVKRNIDPETGEQTFKVVGYKDDGREIRRPVWHSYKLPTFFYKIDIPPVGGLDMKINDVPLYHGGVYEFDSDTLRTVKDMVHRLWRHDRDIHANDENFYRSPQMPRLSARG